jgi:fucose 4-O-acetylase-like acetyltransferase
MASVAQPRVRASYSPDRRFLSWLSSVLLAEMSPTRPASRVQFLDAARGLAIFLVVIGHVVARGLPEGNDWYGYLKEMIYRFHMPLFMVLTGMSFALSLPRFSSWLQVAAFSAKRAERLLVVYLAFGVLILAGKLLAVHFMHVDNPAHGDLGDVFRLLLMPAESVAGFLWFIYVLSVYLLTVPALFQLIGRRPMLLLLAGLALNLTLWPRLFMLDEVVYYLAFFAGGMALWMWREHWERAEGVALWLTTALFVTAAFSLAAPKWLVGALSVLPVLWAMRRLPAAWQDRLAWIGRASLTIYLINTIAIGLTKGLLLRVLPWDGVNFLLYFPVLTFAGVALPMLVKRALAAHSQVVARYL